MFKKILKLLEEIYFIKKLEIFLNLDEYRKLHCECETINLV